MSIIIPLLLLLAAVISPPLHIDSDSTPSDIVKLYNQKIPFEKVVQLIANQTALSSTHTPTNAEISLLNSINDELRDDSVEFFASYGTSGICNPNGIKTSIQLCDKDAAFIHKVCAQQSTTTTTNALTCPTQDIISNSDTYLQKRGISDPQTDALAYFKLAANIFGKLNPSNPIAEVFKIDLTKEGSLKHFGNSSN